MLIRTTFSFWHRQRSPSVVCSLVVAGCYNRRGNFLEVGLWKREGRLERSTFHKISFFINNYINNNYRCMAYQVSSLESTSNS